MAVRGEMLVSPKIGYGGDVDGPMLGLDVTVDGTTALHYRSWSYSKGMVVF